MLDHITVGPLAENPAGKDAIPFVVALILHRQLDEGAGFGRIFPRRGLFTSAQADDRAPDPSRVAGLHLEFADEAVALVEQADDGNALGHWRRAFDPADFLRHTFGFGDLGRLVAAAAFGRRPVARGQRGRRDKRQERDTEGLRPH
ncbi:hypothetical protein HDC35_001790 [Sphingopyxis sp. JAI128]|nr:hypothetical protein [Sphingopyxis sp. JAI128]